MATIDFGSVPDESATPAWRKHAVELAVSRGLIGQAYRPKEQQNTPGVEEYRCVSASEPIDYKIDYHPEVGTVQCSCRAGQHQRPCSHAGAVLLYICGLAPARVRDPEGKSNG